MSDLHDDDAVTIHLSDTIASARAALANAEVMIGRLRAELAAERARTDELVSAVEASPYNHWEYHVEPNCGWEDAERLGQEGWELVAIRETGHPCEGWFKRPVSTEESR